jgi:hypothetical protein
MNKKIQKLQSYLDKYLGKTDLQIMKELNIPLEDYLENTLIYIRNYKIFFRDEIAFFIEKGKVTDISISECFLWIGLRNIIYDKAERPKYKIINLMNKKNAELMTSL